ncbi:MAG: hypothetical protein SNH79_05125, partial [Rikenellaceae bacterium]
TIAQCKAGFAAVNGVWGSVVTLLSSEYNLLPKGVVVMLESLIKQDVPSADIESLVAQIPEDCKAKSFINEEISWRLEFR